MNIREQNAAIAKACGWKFIKDAESRCDDPYEGTQIGDAWLKAGQDWDKWEYWEQREIGFQQVPPNYVNSLDAIHEAENCLLLMNAQLDRYQQLLIYIVSQDQINKKPSAKIWFNATAEQRAKALLKTLKLWKE